MDIGLAFSGRGGLVNYFMANSLIYFTGTQFYFDPNPRIRLFFNILSAIMFTVFLLIAANELLQIIRQAD